MNNLTIIACIGENKELGYKNNLIWHIKEDLQFFKKETIDKEIVMGRKTLESLPGLLQKRKHLVISSHNIDLEDVVVFSSISKFLEYASSKDNEIMIIGGASIYKELLPYTNKMILTEVSKSSIADVYFPNFDKNDWKQELIYNNENNIKYKRLVYKRNNSIN